MPDEPQPPAQPDPPDVPDDASPDPENTPPDNPQRAMEPHEQHAADEGSDSPSGDTASRGDDTTREAARGDVGEASPSTAVPDLDTSTRAGRRVTRRTVHRRETETHTEETITEDLPVYQGPSSAHPAPVG
jgi:hypothetical protein